MAISGKDAQGWMWRVLKISMTSAYTLVKNHPFVSCPVLFFLVLYICFPSFFWISLYSSVFLILAVLATRIYLRHRNAKSFRRDEKKSDAEPIRKDGSAENYATKNRNDKSLMRAQSVRRRKPKATSRDSSLHTSEDEKNTIFSSSFNNDMVDKSALTEERSKEIREIGVDSVISHAECSSSNESSVLRPERRDISFEGSRKFGGGGSRDVEMESSDGTDEEDEQEREANNKAVQWTEADQKNLMDLGFSEIERNKRLESLIARRRARKLLSLQVRRPVVNMDILENHGPMTSLMIPRINNPFLASHAIGNFSPMPGSAPSVLLPNQNPFDLPYDPQEEKPNLTGGSFHQEFQDMTFSRPESVGLGASFPGEVNEDQQETSLSHNLTDEDGASESLENSKVEGQLGEKDTDKIIEVESWHAPKCKLDIDTADKVIKEEVPDSKQGMDLVNNCEEKSSEVEAKSILVEDSIDKLSSASSSEDDVPTYRVDKEAVLKSLVRNMSLNREGNSQMGYVGNNYYPSVDMNKIQEHLSHVDKAMHHNHNTSVSSIASDLQVEVSEVSWSGLTDDGSISPPDEEISAYKGDMERKSPGSFEDIRATSSQLPPIDENESKELYDTNEVGFSRNKESENHILHELEEQVIEHNRSISPERVFSAYKGDIESQNASGNENIRPTSSQPHQEENESKKVYDTNEDSTMEVGLPRTKESENHFQNELVEEVIEHNGTDSLSLSASTAALPAQSQGGASSFHSNIEDKFQSSISSDLSQALASDPLASPVMDKMQQLEDNSTVDTSQDNVYGKTEQPSYSSDESMGKFSTIYNIDDSKILQDNDKEFNIRETDDSVDLFTEQGRRKPTELLATRSSKSADYTGSQPEKMEHHGIVELVGKNVDPKISEEGSDLKDTKQDKMDSSMSIEAYDSPESIQVDEGEGPRAELRSSGLHPNFSDRQVRALLPASILEQFHIDSSISSPRSVLHRDISVDPSPYSNSSDDMHVGIEQFHPQRVENSRLDESRGEGLACAVPQSSMLLMVDSRSYPLHEESANMSEELSNHSKSTEEANSTVSVNEDMVHENEETQNKTNYIPEGSSGRQEPSNLSLSTDKANSESASEVVVHENERRQNKTNYVPQDSSGRRESSNISISTEEDNSTGSLGQDMVNENEMRKKKTDYIPEGRSERKDSFNLSTSAEEDNSQSERQKLICKNETRLNEMKVIPDGSLPKLSSPVSTAALSKLPKQINSEMPDVGEEFSKFLISTEQANSLGSVSKQVIDADEKKQNITNDISEGSSNSSSIYDSRAVLSEQVEERNSSVPVFASNGEANPMGTVSEQVIPESERRQEETKDMSGGRLQELIPGSTVALSKGIGEIGSGLPHSGEESSNLLAPPEEAYSMRFVNEQIIHENEKGQNEAKDIPKGSSQGLSGPDTRAGLSKSTEKTISRSTTMTNNRSDKLDEHEAENEAIPALLNPTEQVNKLNAPVINREEISQFQENPLGVTYKEEFLNSINGEAQASTNPTTSEDSQGTANELQKLGGQKDHTGLMILLDTSKVSTDKSKSADEKKGEFSQPLKGELEISSRKEITEVEPSKSAEENNSANNHIFSTEAEITMNAPAGRSSEEEVSGNPNTEKSFS